MHNNDSKDLWLKRRSKGVGAINRFILIALIGTGLISIFRLADWWFRAEHVGSVFLYILLSLIFWYGILRMILMWANNLGLRRAEHKVAPENLRVAIFTTSSPGEPLSMFEKTLEACSNIKYPHTTYLLDDTADPGFRQVAEKHGAVWLELIGLPGAKAGKINRALELTDEDYILVLDPDHIPFPNFLDEVLGQFEDEKVGFVQVSQGYYNQYRSFVARGAAEQTYAFYGPTMMALYGHKSTVAIGANCTFRRKALESIGGHGIGLAEDLVTSIRLHGAHWDSIYIPKVVSRGLVPEDLGSFCKQQLKWARGVHEILFSEIPHLFRELNWWQRITYLGIGTYYLVGATTFFYLIIPFLFFWSGILPAQMSFVEFLLYATPVFIIALTIYLYMQQWLCHPETERGLHWRGMILKFACWPVHFLGFLLAVINAKIPYIPTAKKAVKGFTPFTRPLIIHILIFTVTIAIVAYSRRYIIPESELILSGEKTWGMIGFATVAVLMAIGGVYGAWQSRNLPTDDPWDTIDIKNIGNK